jgi:hypothetical protein
MLAFPETQENIFHYFLFLTGPTFIFSVTVVAGRLLASLSGTNWPDFASLTLVDVLLIIILI